MHRRKLWCLFLVSKAGRRDGIAQYEKDVAVSCLDHLRLTNGINLTACLMDGGKVKTGVKKTGYTLVMRTWGF